MKTYYLNNRGARWTVTDKAARQFYLKMPDGTLVERHAIFFSQFGQFAKWHFKIGKIAVAGLPRDCETHNGKPVIYYNKLSGL